MPPKIPGKKTFSVNVPDELYDSLKRWAEQKEWSVSKAAWKLIEIGLTTENQTEDKTPKRTKSK